MLPSLDALLSIWNDPVEFVEIQCETECNNFHCTLIVAPPNLPPLVFKFPVMRTGTS